MDQRIAFVRSKDDTNIAYALSGDGPPFVRAGTWLTHVHHDWDSPIWQHWLRFMSTGRTLVRYDPRGCGLSQTDVERISLDAWVDDLEAVVERLQLESFPLFGMSQGAAVAVEYAIRHPQRVSQLILYSPLLTGWRGRADVHSRQWQAMEELVSTGWGEADMAFPSMFAHLFIPESPHDTKRWYAELQRKSASKRVASGFMRVLSELSSFSRLALIRVPTVIIQIAREHVVNPHNAAGMARAIPSCELVSIDGSNHILLEDEPGWDNLKETLDRCVPAATQARTSPATQRIEQLSKREREIVAKLAQGWNNNQIADGLFISEKTVRNHVTNILGKLGVSSREQAIVIAKEAGL